MERDEAVRLAWECLNAEGCRTAELVLGIVRFVPHDDPFSPTGRDGWFIAAEPREPDPDSHPSGTVVRVDIQTGQARRIALL